MKPTSIIFLIVSVLLACVGLLLCFTATTIAANEGTAILSQTGSAETGYNYTTTFTVDEAKTAQISMDLGDVDVRVYPTDGQTRIELVNFPEGTYNYAETKTSVKITDNASWQNILDIDNFRIHFNGFRDYLHWYRYRNNRKSVILYIGKPEHLTKLSIVTEGDILLDGTSSVTSAYFELNDTDCELTAKGGDFTVKSFRSNSLLRLEATDESVVSLDSVVVNTLEIYGVNSFVEMKSVSVDYAMFIELNQGSVEYSAGSFDLSSFDLVLSARNGTVKYRTEMIRNGIIEEYNYSGSIPDDTESDEQPDDTEEAEETGEEETESSADGTDTDTASGTDAAQTYQLKPHSVIIVVKKGDITLK
ncbi:MAG: hypothetical protein ILO42_03575 [Clostridia bacterium]|nr:hypothetical protein [Clostridia bacterium]